MNDNTTSIIDILNGSRRPQRPDQNPTRPPQRPSPGPKQSPTRPPQRPGPGPKQPPSQPKQPSTRPPQRPGPGPKQPPTRPPQRPDQNPTRPPSQPKQPSPPPVIIRPPVEVPASPLDVRSGPLTTCGTNQITLSPSSGNNRSSINIYPGNDGWLSRVPSSPGLKICRGPGSVDLQAHANSNNGIYSISELSPSRNDPLSIRGPSQNAVAQGAYSTIAGGSDNYIGVSGIGSSIGGGSFNRVALIDYNSDGSFRGINYSSSGSGSLNSMYSTIGGGRYNLIGSYASTIAGGVMNVSTGVYSTIGGGKNNQINHLGATIPGGIGLISMNDNHVVLGKYNDLTNDGLTYNAPCFNHDPANPPEIAFSIGWGEEENRVDIFRIYSNGDVWTAGNFSSCPQ